MEVGNTVKLRIRAAVRRRETVINNLKPFVLNPIYQANSPINGFVEFVVQREVANTLMKTLDVFRTEGLKTFTIPKHLKAASTGGPNNTVQVACIVKLGREKKLIARGKKLGIAIKAEEALKKDKKVGKITFAFSTSSPRNAASLVSLINSQERIERAPIVVK